MVERLRESCPEVTASKLHFWEREGLITPRRTPGGHRLYCPADVERLRLILELRTHRRLPLETIKALLQRMEEDPTYRFLVMERTLHEEAFDPAFHPLSRSEAAAQAGLTEAQVRELEALGLVLPCPKTGRFDEEAVHLLRVLAGLLAMGFTPEDLRFYARWAQEVARHERALFAGLCQDGGEEAERMARYQHFRQLVGPLLRLLHLNYLRRTLYDLLGSPEQGTEG